ncbi:MAG: hypothetical protein KGJ86_05995 [Chloroflexota bacterium]|nr:hypothetical protein [Chloroflexota bacterium]
MAPRFSALFLAGLIIFALGAAGDLTYHALEQVGPMPLGRAQQTLMGVRAQAVFGEDGQYAHLVTLAGMVVTVAGVMRRGLARKG